jgi:hypothetical protein
LLVSINPKIPLVSLKNKALLLSLDSICMELLFITSSKLTDALTILDVSTNTIISDFLYIIINTFSNEFKLEQRKYFRLETVNIRVFCLLIISTWAESLLNIMIYSLNIYLNDSLSVFLILRSFGISRTKKASAMHWLLVTRGS